MTGKPEDFLVVTSMEATQTSTVIDAAEFDRELLDRRWREFCRAADRYVIESTRPLSSSS